MAIPVQNARKVFTTVVANMFEDFIDAPRFLRSFAPDEVYRTKTVQLLARRATEKIAVDVIRGDKGNYNKMDRFTLKEYLPPYYKELTNITALDIYDVPFSSGDNYNTAQIEALAREAIMTLNETKKKIDRAIELQMAQLLLAGIVLISNGDSIDYNRKATMKEVLAGGDLWDATGVDLLKFFEDKGQKLRDIGKVPGGNDVDVIMGNLAWQAFRTNADLNDKDKFFENRFIDGDRPDQFNSIGGAYRITLKMGVYNYNIWTYDETYDNASDVTTRYFNSKQVVLIPKNFRAETSFAQVPKLPDFIRRDPRSSRVLNGLRGRMPGFDLFDHVNDEDEVYSVGVKAAPLAQLISVDRLYSAQVLA